MVSRSEHDLHVEYPPDPQNSEFSVGKPMALWEPILGCFFRLPKIPNCWLYKHILYTPFLDPMISDISHSISCYIYIYRHIHIHIHNIHMAFSMK